MRTRSALLFIPAILVTTLGLTSRTDAGGLGVSLPHGNDPDSVQATEALIEKSFYAYRPRNSFSLRAGRDFEFLWSDSFNIVRGWAPDGGMIPTDKRTLDTLGVNLVEKPSNPFRANLSDIRLVHDYFQHYPGRQPYDPNPQALCGFLLGNEDFEYISDPNRNHVDYYLFYPGEGGRRGGQWPSAFIAGTEDTSTTGPPVARRPTGGMVGTAFEVTRANASDGYVTGVEAGLDVRYRAWSVIQRFAWQRGRIDQYPTSASIEVSEPASRLAPTFGALALRWADLGGRIWAEGSLVLAARQDRLSTADRLDTSRIPPGGTPGYTLVSLRGRWRAFDRLGFTAAVENLTDEAYRMHGSGSNEAGRDFVLATSLEW